MSDYSIKLKQSVIACCLNEANDLEKSIPCEVGFKRTDYPLDENKYIDDNFLGKGYFLLKADEIADVIEEVYGFKKWTHKIDFDEKLNWSESGLKKQKELLKELGRDINNYFKKENPDD